MDITTLVAAIEGRLGEDAFAVVLSGPDWQALASVLERRELHPGELLLRRGQADARAFLVERGQLQVYVTGEPPGSQRTATLHAGTVVGESGLFGATPCAAHVEAVTPCVVWVLAAARLQALATTAPALVAEVLRAAGAVLALRQRAQRERGTPWA